jgi:hypothetical protein
MMLALYCAHKPLLKVIQKHTYLFTSHIMTITKYLITLSQLRGFILLHNSFNNALIF